ncbi:MAG TPA: hypothetical protein VM694_17220 [Polyangium sp.]|nr:hypothetical protein [Polyangium sp.]
MSRWHIALLLMLGTAVAVGGRCRFSVDDEFITTTETLRLPLPARVQSNTTDGSFRSWSHAPDGLDPGISCVAAIYMDLV